MKNLIRLLAIASFLLFSFSVANWAHGGNEWTSVTNQNGVEIFKAYLDCDNGPKVAFKIVNSNIQKVDVSWASTYKLGDISIPTDEKFRISVNQKSKLVGSCESNDLSSNPFKYVSTFSSSQGEYELTNLTIE